MRAAILVEPGAGLTLADVSIQPPMSREVLIRTYAAGVCHTDISVIDGSRHIPTPLVLGHEASGIVESVGAEVVYVRPGDRVVTCLSVFCGRCDWCISGNPAFCNQSGLQRGEQEQPRLRFDGRPVDAFGQIGAFAEQMLVHENAVAKIDSAIPLDVAAVLGCAVVTGMGAVFRTAKVSPGDSVAVLGCGGVGLNCIQGARIAGASQIIAIDRIAGRLDFAARLGATHMIQATETTANDVLRLSRGGVNHCFEVIGHPDTVTLAFEMLRRGGTCTVVGALPTGAQVTVPGEAFALGKTLRGCRMGSNQFRIDIPRYLDLYADERLRLDELVTHRVALPDLTEALESLSRGDGARAVITFEEK